MNTSASLYEDYWLYELGEPMLKMPISEGDVHISVSEKRLEVSPFHVTFPFLYKEVNGERYLSVCDLALLEDFFLNGCQAQMTIREFIKILASRIPECKILDTNRYLAFPETVENTAHPYKKVNESALLPITQNSSLLREELLALQEEKRLFVELHNEKAVSWALLTRLDGSYAEISISTAKEFRQRGFATLLAARVLACLNNQSMIGIWVCEAANLPSNAIAHNLGLACLGQEILGFRTVGARGPRPDESELVHL